MAELEDVRTAVDAARAAGAKEICLLQCTVSYPTPPDQVNLAAMDTLRAEFDCPIGLSDHTLGIWAPIAAAARGANLIEKHITLDRGRGGPDHQFAIEPDELRSMVIAVRDVEAAIGSGTKERLPAEEEIYRLGRRNLVVVRGLEEGHVIGLEDLDVLRSPLGIAPSEMGEVLGRRLARRVDAFETLQWDDLA
jgi:sialic acid synthase SpsE